MKISRMALNAALACVCFAGSTFAQEGHRGATSYQKTAYSYGYEGEASPSDAAKEAAPAATEAAPAAVGCDNGSGCDTACDAMGGCGTSLCGLGLLGDCNLGDPWKLCDGDVCGWNIGGWTQLGYHTYATPFNFNNHPSRVNLQQQWLYAEKVADGSCGIGFGGRIDYVYGVDAQDTQAFGTQQSGWDNPWDNGIYGHALPQAYGEVAFGDWSVKAGHFFTLIGNEVVAATGNFFYSHSYTMYNSEPFTHTGVLSTYKLTENTKIYNGYVMGWDSGFDDNGDSWLTGLSTQLTDNVSVAYGLVLGRFGARTANEVGEMHSLIVTSKLTDKLSHVFWTDYLDSDNGTNRAVERQTYDLNNALIYSFNNCLAWGNRFEWYNVERATNFGAAGLQPGRKDVYVFTTGLNVRPHSNLLFRPEVRWDWDQDNLIGLPLGSGQTTFGMDAIFTF
jgi:hypothetical protein